MAFTEDEMKNGIPNMYVGWIKFLFIRFMQKQNYDSYT